MPQSLTVALPPAPSPESSESPFLLRKPGGEAAPIVTAAPRALRADPFEVRLSGKLMRAQLRGTLPARIR